MKTLILGGVRSGKSRYAETLASASGGPVSLIATATADDEEMAARIENHRRHRPAHFAVIEEPLRLAAALARAPAPVVIVDCMTLWLSNLIERDPQNVGAEMAAFTAALAGHPGDCILISNEVGFGVIPVNPLARRFCDLSGELHQELARRCDRVLLMVAGMPLTVKDKP